MSSSGGQRDCLGSRIDVNPALIERQQSGSAHSTKDAPRKIAKPGGIYDTAPIQAREGCARCRRQSFEQVF
jgi:hypothetical protein